MKTLADFDWPGKVALLRAELNVPVKDGKVADTARIDAVLPTIRDLLEHKAGIVLMSHFGRPPEGSSDPKWSLAPVRAKLAELLEREIAFSPSLDEASRPSGGELVLLENTRLNRGEKAGDPDLAARYAALGDVFVLEAFGSAHRKDASLVALAQAAGDRCAGPLLEREVAMLGKARSAPRLPQLIVAGGAKISDKLGALVNLAETAEHIAVGGGIANTFLAAQGKSIGKSLWEPEMKEKAQQLLDLHPDLFIVPGDVIVAAGPDAPAGIAKPANEVDADDMILDIGPAASKRFADEIARAGTVIWAGAMGVFESAPFAAGTEAVASAMASSEAYTVAGGGETLAAVRQFGAFGKLDYTTTGGSAFLEFMEGKELPAIAALQ